jgi:hypothetical protein
MMEQGKKTSNVDDCYASPRQPPPLIFLRALFMRNKTGTEFQFLDKENSKRSKI